MIIDCSIFFGAAINGISEGRFVAAKLSQCSNGWFIVTKYLEVGMILNGQASFHVTELQGLLRVHPSTRYCPPTANGSSGDTVFLEPAIMGKLLDEQWLVPVQKRWFRN